MNPQWQERYDRELRDGLDNRKGEWLEYYFDNIAEWRSRKTRPITDMTVYESHWRDHESLTHREWAEIRAGLIADKFVKRGTDEQWSHIRWRVFRRDNGICAVCKNKVDFGKEYECGHVVSRMYGGTDLDDNLVVMCVWCNRMNPEHQTRESFDAWVASGYWKPEIICQPAFKVLVDLYPDLSEDELCEIIRRRRLEQPRSWVDRKNQRTE
jgi:hypothetical protein